MRTIVQGFYKLTTLLFAYSYVVGQSAHLGAQTSVTDGQRAARGIALASQQDAILKMQESIARQRSSIQQQSGHENAGDFFMLPPPSQLDQSLTPATEPACAPLPDAEAHSLAGQAAVREGLDEDLLVNIMRQESAFRPCAVSTKGALGLMQLMPSTAEQLGVIDSFDPVENVNAGAKFLKQLLSRYDGDVFKALSAYNAGHARVDAAEGIPQIPETLEYVKRILYQGLNKQDQ